MFEELNPRGGSDLFQRIILVKRVESVCDVFTVCVGSVGYVCPLSWLDDCLYGMRTYHAVVHSHWVISAVCIKLLRERLKEGLFSQVI